MDRAQGPTMDFSSQNLRGTHTRPTKSHCGHRQPAPRPATGARCTHLHLSAPHTGKYRLVSRTVSGAVCVCVLSVVYRAREAAHAECAVTQPHPDKLLYGPVALGTTCGHSRRGGFRRGILDRNGRLYRLGEVRRIGDTRGICRCANLHPVEARTQREQRREKRCEEGHGW